jgi:hypothetical protein
MNSRLFPATLAAIGLACLMLAIALLKAQAAA